MLKIKNYLSTKYLQKLYFAFILPQIEYCNISYFFHNIKLLKKIIHLNEKILVIINLNFKQFSVKYRLFIKCCKFLYKIHNIHNLDHFNQFLTSNSSTRKRYNLTYIYSPKLKLSYLYWGSNLSNFLFNNHIFFEIPFSEFRRKCHELYMRQHFDILSIIR